MGILRVSREPAAAQTQTVPASIVAIEIRKPTPPPVPRATPAVLRTRAAPRSTFIAKRSGGSKGGPKFEVHTQHIVHHKESLPIWWTAPHAAKVVANTGTGTQTQPGLGAGTGAGAGNGVGAGAASGAGGGTGGNGSGAANAEAPCGTPVFYGFRAGFSPANGFAEHVRVQLTLGNGAMLEGDFPYLWHYRSEAEDPFSPKTAIPEDEPIAAQLPPAGFDVSREPAAVQLTLKNTLPNGLTVFAPCPVSKSRNS